MWLVRHDGCPCGTHSATEILGCVGANATLARRCRQVADAYYAGLRQRTVLPPREISRVRLPAPISAAHHARSKQCKRCFFDFALEYLLLLMLVLYNDDDDDNLTNVVGMSFVCSVTESGTFSDIQHRKVA